jgi:hypothetical protein
MTCKIVLTLGIGEATSPRWTYSTSQAFGIVEVSSHKGLTASLFAKKT